MGSPLAERTNLPPLRVNLHARGDTNSALIESASISAPWLQADLSRNLKIYFAGKLVREPAALNVTADLAQQPWVALQGILKGQAELAPTEGKFPSVRFQLAGSNVGSAQGRRIPGSAAILGGDSAPENHAGKDAGAPGKRQFAS